MKPANVNPLLKLPAATALLALPPEQREPLARLLTELRVQANEQAELAWKRRKGPMAAYWRAVSTYARHVAHVLRMKVVVKRSLPADVVGALQQVHEWMDGYVDINNAGGPNEAMKARTEIEELLAKYGEKP